MINNNITGIILSGGKSRRMGQDKGLCDFMGKPLIEHAVDLLSNFTNDIIISSNNIKDYTYFGYPVVSDIYSNTGPIGGIHSGLSHSKTEKNIIISCDSPFLDIRLFNLLLEYSDNYQIAVPSHNNGLLEPLAAYYSKKILQKIEESISEKDFKIINLFNKAPYITVRVDNQPFYTEKLFSNLNTPGDLQING